MPKTLKPHFPASSPTELARLQNELCKCLCQLKEVGVLGKHIVVTRSLLEECRGPGIERLLASLSTEALCHRIVSDKDQSSVFHQYLRRDAFRMRECAGPMGLAYRHALAAQLGEKAVLERRWRRLDRALNAKADQLIAQEQLIDSSASPRKDKKVPRRTVDRLRQHLEMNWAGDKRWVDAILGDDGDEHVGDMLDQPFVDVWNHATKDTLHTIRSTDSNSLLRDLEARVHTQSSRLEKWKALRDSLADSAAPPQIARQAGARNPQTSLDSDWTSTTSDRHCETKPPSGAASLSHEEVDNRARQSTTVGPVTRSKSGVQAAPTTAASFSTTKENQHPAYFLRSRTAETRNSSTLEESQSETDLPLQRRAEPATSIDRTPNENGLVADGRPEESREAPRRPALEDKLLPSLAERTRMSMALMSPLKGDSANRKEVTRPHSSSDQRQSVRRAHTASDSPSLSESTFDTLADRARQSINLPATKTPAPRRPTTTRPSSMHDTRKAGARRPTHAAEDVTDTTLLEALEGMDGDYESIFKPRPRVALSPVISPLSGASIDKLVDLNGHGSDAEDDFS